MLCFLFFTTLLDKRLEWMVATKLVDSSTLY